MRIATLSIRNFRGIRDLTLTLDGNSAAILGPNGTGKSSIADAIDFLMRGGIRHLEGEGAGELSVVKHGPTIGTVPKDSWVEAELLVVDGQRITVRRTVADPSDLYCSSALPADVISAMTLASEGGHHLLTRRELLQFVFTEPGNRAAAVGALLHLDGVESSRREIQGAARDAVNANANAKGRHSALDASAQKSFTVPLGVTETVKDRVNSLRAVLNGLPLDSLDPIEIASGLTSPTQAAIHPLQSTRNQSLLRDLIADTIDPLREHGSTELASYITDARQFRNDELLQLSLRSVDLVKRGIQLLDGDFCPLCFKPQPQQEFRAFLEERAIKSKTAIEQRNMLDTRRLKLLSQVAAHIQRTSDVHAGISQKDELPVQGIVRLHEALAQVSSITLRSLENTTLSDNTELTELKQAIIESSSDISKLREILRLLPATSLLQSAWDQLNQYGKALAEQRVAANTQVITTRIADFLKRADECFLRARDSVLQKTYDSVATRMADVYRLIHGADESSFAAEMIPTRAGLKLAVEFRDQGRFPPSALHSEGHQDSMGLCFFLALSAQLAGNALPFVVLDDVVMSVDYGHRRGVADVLASNFGERQLIITTHDRVWWRQLRSAGVVAPKNSIEFVGWTLEDGPQVVRHSGEAITAARDALTRGSAPQAAHALRRAIEEVFPEICDSLGARVRYRADGANDAGEFVQAAISRLKDLVGKARISAQEWKKDDTILGAFAQRRADACAAFDGEQWLVNPTLHFNSWTANMSAGDLEPVITAYESLFSLFSCASCSGILMYVENGKVPSMLRCSCGAIIWNLERPIAKK